MNYIFVNKNKRNTYKILCKYFKTNYFDFFVVNNLFNAKTFQIEQRLLYLILVMNQVFYQDVLKQLLQNMVSLVLILKN